MYPAIVQNTDEEPANQTCQTEHRDGPIQFPPQAVHFGTHMVTGVAQIVFHLRNGIIDAPGRAKPGIREILHRGGKLITRGPQPGGMRPHRIRHSRQTGLLELLPQTQLISGLYSLAYPLRWLGLSRERIAVRLALTLEYAESAMRDTASDWRSTINAAMQPSVDRTEHIELRVQPFRAVDILLLAASAAVLIGVWR